MRRALVLALILATTVGLGRCARTLGVSRRVSGMNTWNFTIVFSAQPSGIEHFLAAATTRRYWRPSDTVQATLTGNSKFSTWPLRELRAAEAGRVSKAINFHRRTPAYHFDWKLEAGFFVCRDRAGREVSRVGANGQDVSNPVAFRAIAPIEAGSFYDRLENTIYSWQFDRRKGEEPAQRPINVSLAVTKLDGSWRRFVFAQSQVGILTDRSLVVAYSSGRVRTWSWPSDDDPIAFWEWHPASAYRPVPVPLEPEGRVHGVVAATLPIRPLDLRFNCHTWVGDHHHVEPIEPVRAPDRAGSGWGGPLLVAAALFQPPPGLAVSHVTAGPSSLDEMFARIWRDPLVAQGGRPVVFWLALVLALLCALVAWRGAAAARQRRPWTWALVCLICGVVGLVWMRYCIRRVAGPDPATLSTAPKRLVLVS